MRETQRLSWPVARRWVSCKGSRPNYALWGGLERAQLEDRVEVGDVLAAGRRGTADEVEYPAVLHAVVGESLRPAVLVEIDCDHALVGHRLRHEVDLPLGALGNVVKCFAARGRAR